MNNLIDELPCESRQRFCRQRDDQHQRISDTILHSESIIPGGLSLIQPYELPI